MSGLSVTFKDRLCFEAHSCYHLNPKHHHLPHQPHQPSRKLQGDDMEEQLEDKNNKGRLNLDFSLLGTCISGSGSYGNKAWRGVHFAPRYHAHSVKSPEMSFHKTSSTLCDDDKPETCQTGSKNGSNKRVYFTETGLDSVEDRSKKQLMATPLENRNSKDMENQSKKQFIMTPSGVLDHDGRFSQALRCAIISVGKETRGRDRQRRLSSKHPTFRTRFLISKPKDDQVERALERRFYVSYPYTNPQPFDHRQLDLEEIKETRLHTKVTPEPLNYKLPLLKDWKPGQQAVHRNINFKLKTSKAAEPRYDHSLILEKGRYSPAFSAYNAYLDRIFKTLSTD